MKRKLLLTISLCLIFTWSGAVHATEQTLSEIKRARDEINQQLSNTKNELSAIQTQIYQTQLKIIDLDERLTIALNDLEVINGSIGTTETRFDEIESELETAQQKHDRQFEAYKERVRVMYEYGNTSYLEILLQTTSMSEFLTQLEYLNAIAKHDNEMVQRLDESEDRLLLMREEYDRTLNTLEELKFSQEALTEEIEETLAEQKVFMEDLLESEANAEQRIEIEAVDAAALDAAYAKAKAEDDKRKAEEAAREAERRRQEQEAARRQSAATAGSYNGTLNWPVPSSSRITEQYGWRRHPISGKEEFHKGIDIGAPMGSDIVASDSGTVLTAGYNWSYGNYVVISHSGGLGTLYAHASKLLVSEGQTVSKGDVIAKIGSTGVSTGPHLHYEVHIGGEHTSPRSYLNY